MSEATSHTTSNGHEIEHPREVLNLEELQQMTREYGMTGQTSAERARQLKQLSADQLALFISDINRRAQGSDDTLVHEKTMKIGEKPLVAPESRYDLFRNIVDRVRESPDELNPARVGDALALSTVILHPFKDGNGRTARMLGFVFRDDFTAVDAQESFDTLVKSRDISREEGGFMINGYIPYFPEGVDQSQPEVVESYIGDVLSTDSDHGLYTGPYGQAPLVEQSVVGVAK